MKTEHLIKEQKRIRDMMNEDMDEILVNVASDMMREKLAESRAKGRNGWWDESVCSKFSLRDSLNEHVEKGDPVDVMNIAAMLAVRNILDTKICVHGVPGCNGGSKCTSDHK